MRLGVPAAVGGCSVSGSCGGSSPDARDVPDLRGWEDRPRREPVDRRLTRSGASQRFDDLGLVGDALRDHDRRPTGSTPHPILPE